jgi:hypothetical protein
VESVEAAELLAQACRHFRYAFRKHPSLLGRLPAATSWMTDADRIQALNNMAVLGREHVALLRDSGFSPAQLDELADKSDALADRKSKARCERASGRGSKLLRDRAYTHLRAAVEEIRAAGRFLFWNDEGRLAGYRSEYKRKNRGRTDSVDAGVETDEVETAASAQHAVAGNPAVALDAAQ